MKEKIKQEGFAQIPLIITIIIVTIIISGSFLYSQGKLRPLFASISLIFQGNETDKQSLGENLQKETENKQPNQSLETPTSSARPMSSTPTPLVVYVQPPAPASFNRVQAPTPTPTPTPTFIPIPTLVPTSMPTGISTPTPIPTFMPTPIPTPIPTPVPLAPIITGVDPTEIALADPILFTIYGQNLKNNAEVIINNYQLGHFKITDNGSLQKTILIEDPKILSQRTNAVEVINPDGQSDIEIITVYLSEYPHPLTDKTAPFVSLEDWKSSIMGSFSEHDWGKNGGKPYGTLGLWTNIFQDSQPSSGIEKIEYYVDDSLIASSSSFTGNKIAWDTTTVSNGEHIITAKVYDRAGNMGIDSVEIEIENK